MKYSRIIAAVVGEPWAVDAAKAQAMIEFLALAAAGGHVPGEQAAKLNTRAERKIAEAPGGVAVIPLHGVLAQRVGMLEEMSGGTSTDVVGRQISAAAEDQSIKAIVLHIESPGGSVYGLRELASRITEAKALKPVIAQVDSYAASAAYWAASQASEIVVTPGGDVGSIGVLAVHDDFSRQLEEMGVTKSVITSAKYKAEGSPFEPLGDEARANMQARVDAAHEDFLAAVAGGRGVSVDVVAENFGQGRMVQAEDAIRRGMADRIATFSQTLSRFTSSASAGSRDRRRAELDLEELT